MPDPSRIDPGETAARSTGPEPGARLLRPSARRTEASDASVTSARWVLAFHGGFAFIPLAMSAATWLEP